MTPIKRQALVISTEAMRNPFTMITPVIKDNLLKISGTITGVLTSVEKRLMQVGHLSKTVTFDYELVSEVDKIDYIEIRNIMVPVPRGFSGDYLSYVTNLRECYNDMLSLVEDTLVPAERVLGLLLANPETAVDVTLTNALKTITYHDDTLKRFIESSKSHFSTKDTAEFQKYGNLFKRNSDFKDFNKEIVALSQDYTNHSKKKIIAQVKNINQLADLLYIRLKNDQLGVIQNSQAQVISELLPKISNEIEMFASMCVFIEQQIAYSTTISKHLHTVLKK